MTQSTSPATEATRQRLLDGAEALFAERGFEGTSLQALMERTGVNKALVSYHFGGKEGLYRAVLRSCLGALREPLEELRTGEGSAANRLRGIVEAVARTCVDRPALPAILLREHLAGGTRIDGDVFEDLAQGLRTTERVLQDGIASGDFVEADAHSLHLSIVGGIAYFMASVPFRNASNSRVSAPAVDAFIRHTQDLFVRALAASGRDNKPTRIGEGG